MTELERLFQILMDAEGYVIFIGHLKTRPKSSPDAERETDVYWEYRRFHFGIEDAIEGVKEFTRVVKEESKRIEKGLDEA